MTSHGETTDWTVQGSMLNRVRAEEIICRRYGVLGVLVERFILFAEVCHVELERTEVPVCGVGVLRLMVLSGIHLS